MCTAAELFTTVCHQHMVSHGSQKSRDRNKLSALRCSSCCLMFRFQGPEYRWLCHAVLSPTLNCQNGPSSSPTKICYTMTHSTADLRLQQQINQRARPHINRSLVTMIHQQLKTSAKANPCPQSIPALMLPSAKAAPAAVLAHHMNRKEVCDEALLSLCHLVQQNTPVVCLVTLRSTALLPTHAQFVCTWSGSTISGYGRQSEPSPGP